MNPLERLLANTPLASKAWRLQNLYTIIDADGRLTPFRPNLAQRKFWNEMWYCNHVLKARKLGFSTFIEILYLDDLLFQPLSAGIIDYTIEDAEAKLLMFHTAWQHLDNAELHPETWRMGQILKRANPVVSSAARKIKFANGSVAKCATSLRGATPQRIHVSELGKTAIFAPIKAREIINGAFNSMTPGNVRNIESTHEGGKAGEHYRLLQNAMRQPDTRTRDTSLSVVQSRFHFFPWHMDPRYVLPPRAKTRPEIAKYVARLHADHGIVLTPDQIQWYDDKHLEQGHGMKKEFPSTPGEAFEAIAEGAIYGLPLADLRAGGRITGGWGHERNLPLFTFSDIGLSDYFSDWLIQPIGRHFLVLDWFEAEGVPGSAVPDHWQRWEAKWGKPILRHFLPHDAETRDRGSGKSYVSLIQDAGRRNVTVVPRTPDVWLGIGYVRDVLPHCWFQADYCDRSRNRDGSLHEPDDSQEDFPSGVACLEGYSKNLNPSGATLREMPKHDLFSHSADAFRTFAEALNRGLIDAHGHLSDPSHQPRAVGGSPRARR